MANILLVDDDSALANAIADWLQLEKHSVTVVRTGVAGWEQLQTNQYELVLLDWDLPGMTGIDILKNFRAASGTTPVIMLTGHTSIDDKEAGFDLGANDYLAKPFHMRELSARIKNTLRSQGPATAPVQPLGQGNEEILKRADLAGTRLAASYEFLDIIGQGSSAIVFKARYPRLDRLVAVKMLHSLDLEESALARFEREARVISQINHYNVITVHDFGVTERNQPYMVMEYVDGESLDERITRDGPAPLTAALVILIQICRGLHEAHSKGIIHRDLKPANILLQNRSDRADWVKIADFGMAHLTRGDQTRLTTKSRVMGTAEFTAPERLRDVPADERSDVYSLGVILFEVLTDRSIFEADTMESLLLKAALDPPEPPSRFRQDIPADSPLDRAVLKATEKNPDSRYQSAAEMRLELEQIHSQLLHSRET